ncbi:CotS family spore coat protein [Bacillus sp. V5-8f]|uniref:CotS family spore coat protein n=1 Tax=Bacillus sp. V5-8f TaxID=2053044 RepID=UPI0015E0F981|nr:CotS family spore coat protein [Bacillus sp. V5-8f]
MAKRKKDIKIKLIDFISDANLEKHWGLTVKNAEQVRAVVKVETDKGTYALKKVDHKPQKLHFIYEAQEHLWKNDFHNQPRWRITCNGQSFVPASDGNFYFLNEWIDGTESDIRKLDQLKEIMRLQAALHHCSVGFSPSPYAVIRTKWHGWDKKYESAVEKLKSLYNEVKQQPESHLGSVFLETAPVMIKMADDGKKHLNATAYQQVLNQAVIEKGFIHGDFAYHNLIRSKDGKMHVIDFDYCSQNLRIHDVARFLRKVMQRANWDIDLNYTILQAYHEINPLCKEELEVLKAVMHLPKSYWKIVERSFITQRYTQEKTVQMISKEAATFDKRLKYLESFPTRL